MMLRRLVVRGCDVAALQRNIDVGFNGGGGDGQADGNTPYSLL